MHITGYLRPSLNRIQRVKPGFIAKFLETNNNDSEKRKMSTRGGRVRAMDEASFFQSADEAEEVEGEGEDAVGGARGRSGLGRESLSDDERNTTNDDVSTIANAWADGERRVGVVLDADAFQDAADLSFHDPADSSNAQGAISSGGEFVSGADTDGGGGRGRTRHRNAGAVGRRGTPSKEKISFDGKTTTRTDTKLLDAHDVAPAKATESGHYRVTDTRTTDETIERTRITAADIAAAVFASARVRDNSSSDGGYASLAGDEETSNASVVDETPYVAGDTSVITNNTDDSFVDSVQEPSGRGEETEVGVLTEPAPTVKPAPPAPQTTKKPLLSRVDHVRPLPLSPPSPPSPLAPGASRLRRASTLAPETRFSNENQVTTPIADVRRRFSVPGDASLEHRTSWGNHDDAPASSARSQRSAALLRDARRSSDDVTSSSSGDERRGRVLEFRAGDGGANATPSPNASGVFSRQVSGSSQVSNPQSGAFSTQLSTVSNTSSNALSRNSSSVSTDASGGFSPNGSPYGEDDIRGTRRASRRRAQREKYALKLRGGFAEGDWMSADEQKKATSAARRNTHSEPDRGRFHDVSHSYFSKSLGSDDGRVHRGRSNSNGTSARERGSATGGERFGSSRSAARAAAAEEASKNFRQSVTMSPGSSQPGMPSPDMQSATFPPDTGTPGMGMGMGMPQTSPNMAYPPSYVPGIAPDAVMWQLQQQQQMMLYQMQQLQLAQQQQQQQRSAMGHPMTHQTPIHPMLHHPPIAGTQTYAQSFGVRQIFQSVARNDVDEVVRLVDSGFVHCDYCDVNGDTLLMRSCQFGFRRITKYLLKKGALVNKQNSLGNTPLHFCLAGGFGELGAYLVGKSADESLENLAGKSPYEGL